MESPLLFDLFGVLMRKQTASCRSAMAEAVGADPAAFSAAYWAHRPAYDRGCSARAYWATVADTLDIVLDEARIERLTAADNRGWSRPDTGVRALLGALRNTGATLYLLSNIPGPLRDHLDERHAWLEALFVHRFHSCDIGVAKPSSRAYEIALSTIRRHGAAGVVRFVDDNAENVEAARNLGLDAHHFVGVSALRAWLADRSRVARV